MTKYNTVALIPVKGNSDRIKKKNTRPFANTNLLELKIKQLINSNSVDKIIVSSESDVPLAIASSFNEVILHKRDSYYSSSYVQMSEVYSHLASEVDSEHIMWVNVTSPLIGPDIYKKSLELYEKKDSGYDCLLSCTRVQEYLLKDFKPINFVRDPWPRSQDLSGIHALTFGINILKKVDLIRWRSLVGKNPLYLELSSEESIDIDFMNDFEFAEFIFKKDPKKYI